MDRRRFLQVAAGVALCPICASGRALAETGHWGYSGPKGPNHWGGVCATGKRQSPVDLRGAVAGNLPKLQPNWSAARSIVNNGHTIEVAAGGSMQLGQTQYQLAQFHFHHPSEHRLNGQSFPMEAHFVHTGPGGRGVVGVMLTRGAPNAAFAMIVAAMPRVAKGSVAAPAGIRPSDLLPASLSYYNYPGSLTTPTPDCEENVNWLVLASPVEVAAADIAKFGALFQNNARPPMPIGSRAVQRSS